MIGKERNSEMSNEMSGKKKISAVSTVAEASAMLRNVEIPYRAPSSEFERFLKVHRVKADDETPKVVTHVNMCHPYGRFSIPQEKLSDFFRLYESEILKGSTIGLAEIPIKHMELPLVIDLDFKWKLSPSSSATELSDLRKHTFSTIRDVLRIYKNVYESFFYFRQNDDRNSAYWVVTQRDAPYLVEKEDVTYVKDGIHVVNPGLRAYPAIHARMRQEVLKNPAFGKIFRELGLEASPEIIVDEQVIIMNAWTMYGSRKPEKASYKLAYLLDMDLQATSQNEVTEEHLPSFLSYWRTSSAHAVPNPEFMESFLNESRLQTEEEKKEEKPNEEKKEKKKKNEKDKNKQNKQKQLQRASCVVEATNPEQTKGQNALFETLKALLGMMNDRRGTEKVLWQEVGESLRCLAPDEQDFFQLWVEFSEKRKKFNKEMCAEEWKFFNRHKEVTLATVKFWASRDSPKKYMAFKRNEIRSFLMKSLNETHFDVAQTLYLLYESRYVCSSIKTNTWYEFKNNRWNEIEAGVSLRGAISRELAREYNRFHKFCKQMAEKLTGVLIEEEALEYDVSPDLPEFDEFTPEEFLNMAEVCDKIAILLKNKGYKDSIMAEAREFFYDDKFAEKLNERHDLIAFDNGVVDLDKKVFREGRPDDYITFSTKTTYLKDYAKTQEYTDIMTFLGQIYGSEDMVHYTLKERAHMIHGDNPEERIFVWTGVGGNGKSKHRELTYVALGDYCIKFPVTLFTGKLASSNTPQPELARAKGARMAYVEEPEEKQTLNMGLMKMMSGGDPIICRQLYGHTFEYIPQFVITLLCNDLPRVPPHDDGSWRRLTVIEHKARFVDNPTKPNEYKKDMQLSSKIKIWKHVYASMLVSYYWVYKSEGLNPPEEVTTFTDQFRKECDAYDEFVSEVLVEAADKETSILLTSLYASFKTWTEDNGLKNMKPMTFREFKKYLQKKIGNPKAFQGNTLVGYRERSSPDSSDATEAILSAAGVV